MTKENIKSGGFEAPLRTANGGDAAIPALGFGTWELRGATCESAVEEALAVGFRHVDTARMYENEVEVGKGIVRSGVDREEIWVTTKVNFDDLTPEGVQKQLEGSLSDMDLDYVDLLLVHWPNPDFDLKLTLDTMQGLAAEQKTRFIGVSNFPPRLLMEALEIAPSIAANQVEYHPFLGQGKLLEMAETHDLVLEAYSPLAHGLVAGSDELAAIGEAHGKNAIQVALRWLTQQDRVVAVTRSSAREHIVELFEIFDFELTADEVKAIDALPKDRRQVDPEWAPEW